MSQQYLSASTPSLNIPFLNPNGTVSQTWLLFLIQLFERTGGQTIPNLNLAQISNSAITQITIEDANGFNGTITSGTTPQVTLETTVTGMVKGNGTALEEAVSGTDYAPPTSGNSILYGNGAGGFSNVTIGANLNFSGGTLSATGGGGTSPTAYAYAARHG
jgi:hypothetical protein